MIAEDAQAIQTDRLAAESATTLQPFQTTATTTAVTGNDIIVQKDGTEIARRAILDFQTGTNTTLNISDDPPGSRTLVKYDTLASVGAPQNSQSANYTTVLSDQGKDIFHPASDNNARTFTIDSNANVAYPVETIICFTNMINTVTIAITSDTMTLLPAGTTGSRTLAANNTAIARKIGTTSWVIYGTSGLT